MNCAAASATAVPLGRGCSSSSLPCFIYLRRRARRHAPPRRPLQLVASSSRLHSGEASERLRQWDEATTRLTAFSNLPFLLIQVPQITLNARNLMSGNAAALLAVPWLGMLTGLLGNLTLLSYFVKKRETAAILVQTLGVVSIYVVLSQLAIAKAMGLPVFVAVSVVVVVGLLLNALKYASAVPGRAWLLWEDFITILGLSVLPQVMWSTFVPLIPNSIVPGITSCTLAVSAVAMLRLGKLPQQGVDFLRSISGWTATLLFMWMPIAQYWTTYLNPDNINGLSPLTILLGLIGNALMVPRALFIRDLMWFTGASWAAILHGWGNLACMYIFSSINRVFFSAATLGLFLWLGFTIWRDAAVYGYHSPVRSFKELLKL